ncbi:MAG: glycosyltransferase [Novosphingobium sp.]
MRLLWLLDSLTVGGAERLAATFARGFDRQRIELQVVSLTQIEGNPLACELEAAGVAVTVIGARSLRDVGAFRRLVRLVRERRFDVIHAHLTYAEIWGRLAGVLTGTPVLSTAHVEGFTNPADPRPRDRLIEIIAAAARCHLGGPVIAVSEALRGRLLARGLPAERVVTLHNGIERDSFAAGDAARDSGRALGIPTGAPLAITVSVMRDGKGHDVLIDAAQMVLARQPDAHFLLVGGGPREAELRALIAARGLGRNVHLAGMRSDVPALLALADLFILPSSQFDSLPTVAMEAMAAGLPVVAFASGGVSEIVADGITGRILSVVDPHALAEAVGTLLAQPETRKTMGAEGQKRIAAEFSAEVWIKRLEAFYADLCGQTLAPIAAAKPGTGAGAALPQRVMLVEFLGRGGLVHYAYQFCQGLADQGVAVELVTDRDYELDALPHRFPVRRLFRMWDPRPDGEASWSTSKLARIGRLARRGQRAVRYYRQWWRLIRLVAKERPDVVQFGEIRFATDLIPLLTLRAQGVQLADVCHNVAPFDISANQDRITKESRWHRAAFRRIYDCFDTIFVHSDVNRTEFARLYGGDPGRIHVIPHGNEAMFERPVDPVRSAALQAELGLAGQAPTVLFFGTLTKYKGVDHLLEAMAKVRAEMPDSRLVVAGFPNPDVDVAALLDRAARPDLAGAVHFHLQYVAIEDVAALFALSDLAVFPYLMIYQSGALQVAYSCGKPVVATRVGGLCEAVVDGETGLLVPPRDPAQLAAAIIALLRDPALARQMGQRGKVLSEQANSWQDIAQRARQAYAAADPARPAPPPSALSEYAL